MPFDFKFENLKILYTLAFWTKATAIVFKEIGHPFLKFDEMNLAYIASWNFINDMWAVDFNSMSYPIGVLLLQLPWFIMLWFLFDGDIESQEMFAHS